MRPQNRRSAPRLPAVALAALAGLAAPALAIDTTDQFPFFDHSDDALPQVVTAREGVLNLRAGDIVIADIPSALDQDGAFAPGWHVIALDGPMTPDRRAALDALGIVLGDYLPTNAFVADVSGATRQAVRALGFVSWAGEFRAAWKIDPMIGQVPMQTPERLAIEAAGNVALNVLLFPGESLPALRGGLAGIDGLQVLNTDDAPGQTRLVVVAPPAAVEQLAALPQVQMIENAEEWTLRNSTSVRWVLQTNVSGQTPFYTNGLTGTGQILGHIDSGVTESQCSMDDSVPIGPSHRKIVRDYAPGSSSHGTMTAGIAVGRGPTFGDNNTGVAYDARLTHNSIPSLGSTALGTMLTNFYVNEGAAVHTNSWGQDFTTAYTAGVREIDRFSFENDDNIVLFAVTNQAGSMYIPENAKNCIGVSGTRQANSQNLWGVGGTGPTADGRRKPDIMSPGLNYVGPSTSGCSTQTNTGTSFACPGAAGAALLAREYFTDGYYPTGAPVAANAFTPSGALIKATLANGGSTLTGESSYPGTRQGWGRVTLDSTFFFPGDARRMIVRDVRNNSAAALTTGQSAAVLFRVNSNQLLRVTSTWHDFPASVNSTFAPVNNLNMTVTNTENANAWLGNVFSGGFSAAGGTADAINNLEQVHLASPAPGVYRVTMSAAAVQQQTQGFAVVIAGDVSPCIADITGNGFVDLEDFFNFLNAFDDSTPGADVDGIPGVDLGDFFTYLNAFDSGC